MKKKYVEEIVIIIICLSSSLLSQSKVGTTAANFTTIPVGARASAMGGAFVAIANDATSAFWNPGGLSRLEANEISVTYTQWLLGTDLNWLGAVMKFRNNAIAFSINQLDYGEEEITTEEEPDGTGQTWEAQDIAFGVSYARNLTDRFSIGGTIKYIQEKIWNESASAFALDVGLLFRTQFNDMCIGMNISNFGTEMQMDGKDLLQPVDIDPANPGNNENIISALKTDSWTLPLTFTVGIGMKVIHSQNWVWTLATDAVYPNSQTPFLNLGQEVSWHDIFALRIGYNSLFKEAAEEGLSAGFGIHYSYDTFAVGIDISYMDFGIFNGVLRYSLAVVF